MAEIVVEGLEVVDVEHQHAERRALLHRIRLRLAQEFVERTPVRQARQRVGPGALFRFGEGIADHVELAGLFGKARLQPRRPGGGACQLVHELRDQGPRVDAGLALIGNVADHLHLGTVVGDHGGQKFFRRSHQRMQAFGRLEGDNARIGRDIGCEQVLIGPGVEGSVVVDQEVDGVTQIVMIPAK